MLSTLPMIIQVAAKSTHLAQKDNSSVKKLQISKAEGFLKSYFDLKKVRM